MSELWQLGALELADKIRSGETTSRAVVEAHLARIDAVNGHLNAVVRRLDGDALAAADAADAAVARGDTLGPFHGVPMTVKENIDLAGTATTQGVAALADAVASIDAPTVERMRGAGAIPIARTNLPDLGLRVHTHSSLHGLTRNPHHADRTAGGSSGGEASAIASGMSPLGLGNDIGGSLRNPAHCCGIASIKPTVGAIPMATVIPPQDQLLSSQQMLVEGPMARRVADVRTAFQVLAGPSPRDPRSVPATFAELGAGERLTVAVLADPPGGNTHPEIAAAVRRAADHLADAGHEVVEATPPDYETAVEMWAALLLSDLSVTRPLLDEILGEDARKILDGFAAVAPESSVELSAHVQATRFRLMREWSEFFASHPILLSPTWGMPPFEHDADIGDNEELIRDTLRPVLPANFLALPGAVVPCGSADGLPVGVQVLGDRFTDLRCLDVAAQIQSAVGAPVPIDPVTA
ncbi:MAG: indole acetimide hydrolase [Acidimicrobiaceae bacterium]|nr:indole acetimide hydrolase [Acidimicrobiaceae bacterium]